MTTPAKPLTADEIARIKRYVSGHRGLATPLAAEEGQSLIATIEQQAEQIEKLRALLGLIREDVKGPLPWTPAQTRNYRAQIMVWIDEALAATEPKP